MTIVKTKTRILQYKQIDSIYFFISDITYGKTTNGYYSKIATTIFNPKRNQI
jgi:hypothetical protein